MALNLDFDELMKYSLICLKYNGAHPFCDLNLLWYINRFFQQAAVTCVLILMLHSILIIDISEGMLEICSLGTFVVMYCVCNFKYFVLLKYKLMFRYLIRVIKEDYVTAESLPEEEQAVVKEYAMRGRVTSVTWLVITFITACIMCLQPLAKMVYYSATDQFRLVQIVPTVYPPFMQDWNETIAYCAIYALFLYYTYFCASLYLGMVPLGPIFLSHASGQMELLKMRILKLFSSDESISFQQRTERLKAIAIHLQTIYDFVEQINTSHMLLYELTMKGTSVITPILFFAAEEAYKTRGEIRTEFFTIFLGAFALSSQPCFYGDMLIEKNFGLRDAVFMSGWEGLYEKKTRSTLLILMTRLTRTVAIQSVFVTVGLAALTDVFRQAYALFSLLHAAL